jgi:hypothetical protein
MRDQDQRTFDDHPDVIESAPVPVPGSPETGTDPGPGETTRDEAGFHPPAPVPTAFGAPTVGGAVAASALASGDRTAEPDPREEETVRPGDGVVAEAETEAGQDD